MAVAASRCGTSTFAAAAIALPLATVAVFLVRLLLAGLAVTAVRSTAWARSGDGILLAETGAGLDSHGHVILGVLDGWQLAHSLSVTWKFEHQLVVIVDVDANILASHCNGRKAKIQFFTGRLNDARVNAHVVLDTSCAAVRRVRFASSLADGSHIDANRTTANVADDYAVIASRNLVDLIVVLGSALTLRAARSRRRGAARARRG